MYVQKTLYYKYMYVHVLFMLRPVFSIHKEINKTTHYVYKFNHNKCLSTQFTGNKGKQTQIFIQIYTLSK